MEESAIATAQYGDGDTRSVQKALGSCETFEEFNCKQVGALFTGLYLEPFQNHCWLDHVFLFIIDSTALQHSTTLLLNVMLFVNHEKKINTNTCTRSSLLN